MGLIDRIRHWIQPPPQPRHPSLPPPATPSARPAEPERERIAREVVAHTGWTEIEFDGELYGEMRHAILRDGAGFWTRLEDSEVEIAAGTDRPIARGPFPSIEAARGAAREEVAEAQTAWGRRVAREQELLTQESTPPLIGDPTRDAPTPTIDRIVQRALERRVEGVPDMPAAELIAQAEANEREASAEAGWDNYSTAAFLRSTAARYRLAAAMRDPQVSPHSLALASDILRNRLLDRVEMARDDEDVGEHTRVSRMDADHALGEIGSAEMLAVIDELEATGCFDRDIARQLRLGHEMAARLEIEGEEPEL